MITEEQLAEWERLSNEAPRGPWWVEEDECGRQDVDGPSSSSFGYQPIAVGCAGAPFVASAREAVPALIAEVLRLRAALAVSVAEALMESARADWYYDYGSTPAEDKFRAARANYQRLADALQTDESEKLPNAPTVLFSDVPVATPEDVATAFGRPLPEAQALLDHMAGPPLVVYKVPKPPEDR